MRLYGDAIRLAIILALGWAVSAMGQTPTGTNTNPNSVATSLAIGGAAIGTNALAVAGSVSLGGNTVIGGNLQIASGKQLQLGSSFAAGATTSTGYVTIADSAGNLYKINACLASGC